MEKRIRIMLIAAIAMFAMTGCGCRHEWVEATCTEPRRCINCEKTDGNPLGHDWISATCTDPRICAVCGETEGEPAGHKWIDATEEAPKTCTICGAMEGERLKKVIVSDWDADYLSYISSKYLLTTNDEGKCVLMNYEGKQIGAAAFFKDIPSKWDYMYTNLQNGCFIAINKYGESIYESYLIDRNLDVLATLHGQDRYMMDFRDNIITIKDNEKNRMEYHPYYEGTEFEEGFVYVTLGENDFISPLSYDTIQWRYRAAVMRADEEIINDAEYKYNCGDYAVTFSNNSVNSDGWILAALNEIIDEGETKRYHLQKRGFYNIKTNEFQEILVSDDEYDVFDYVYEKNGCKKCTVINDHTVICSKDADGNEKYRIYNIKTGLYENDDIYASISLGYWPLLLVKNLDGKWGYISSETYEHVGDWYDDASYFCNGYALINQNGKEYVINENLEIVSEAFDGDGASAITYDYFDFCDLDGKSIFKVNVGGKYHLVTLE